MTRIVTNQDIKNYEPLVNKYLRDSVMKNWNEASLKDSENEVALGNTGMTMADIRQHLLTEVVVALQKYNPDYRTPEGLSVKESTFVFQHLFNRCGQLLKRLTKRSKGYGLWSSSFDDLFKVGEDEG